jgi:hypothetical protein
MKHAFKTGLPAGLIAVALFVTGKLIFSKLFRFFEPHIDGIVFRIRELDAGWKTSTLFSLMLALIPFMIISLWLFAPVVSSIRRIGSILIMLIFMIAGILIRHQEVKMYFIRVVKPFFLRKGQVNVDYPIDPVNFVYYMFAGFCIGYILSYFLFRQKKVKRMLQ